MENLNYIIGAKIRETEYSKEYDIVMAGSSYLCKIYTNLSLECMHEISTLSLFEDTNKGIMNIQEVLLFSDSSVGIIIDKYSTTLADVSEKGMLSMEEKIIIFTKLLHTVCFLHNHHISHNDIVPSNIIVDDVENPILCNCEYSKLSIDDSEYKKDMESVIEIFVVLFGTMFEKIEIKKYKNRISENSIFYTNIISKLQNYSNFDFRTNKFLKIYEHKKIYDVSLGITELCSRITPPIKKHITPLAAQLYLDRTGCAPESAIDMACKFYENVNIDNDYTDPTDNMTIFKKMDYNLYI